MLLCWFLFFCCLISAARAEIQFDVFLGYGDLGNGGIVPESSWFPVVCEVKNDGPTFLGVIEVTTGAYNEGQTRRIVVELPTGTLKRLSIPVFSAGRYASSWDIKLLDERGRLHAEHSSLGPRAGLAAGITLLGALPRTSAGTPVIRQIVNRSTDYQPTVARFPEAAILPDNPLEWEGMDSFYLNSEKAPDLNVDQVNAMLAWLNDGGNLIIGVEAVSDVNATPWLRSIVPFNLTGMTTVSNHPGLEQWLRDPSSWVSGLGTARTRRQNMPNGSYYNSGLSLQPDQNFESSPLLVAIGTRRDGQVLASAADGSPLIVTSHQGRGRVTVLLFNPEREPVRSWKNLPTFWAKLAGVPMSSYSDTPENPSLAGGYSIDGVFGAMIDSRQIRRLPVEWLLLLLIVYLVVIGPFDQHWLKRLKRPMLTWLTFPCYVVCFSLLIYFIGYKLRAGETEWNELHLVDVLVNGDHAELRGRTYASIYSPVNATYRVEGDLQSSTLRGEFHGSWVGNNSQDEHADVIQEGNNFKADIFVPVWTSQLYTSDWWETLDNVPLGLTVVPDGQDWSVTVHNHMDRALDKSRVVVGNLIYDLDPIPASTNITFKLSRSRGTSPLAGFVQSHSGEFQAAVMQRFNAFGSYGSGHIDDLPDTSMAVSLLSSGNTGQQFEVPPGLDLSPLAAQNEAVLLAWEPDYSPVKPFNHFPTRRSRKDTLWRVVVPVNPASAP